MACYRECAGGRGGIGGEGWEGWLNAPLGLIGLATSPRSASQMPKHG